MYHVAKHWFMIGIDAANDDAPTPPAIQVEFRDPNDVRYDVGVDYSKPIVCENRASRAKRGQRG